MQGQEVNASSVPLVRSNLGHFLIIMLFVGFCVPCFLKISFKDLVSARFTASSIFCEKATGDISRVAEISH